MHAIVSDHIACFRPHRGTHFEFYARQRDLQTAVETAALCVRPDGKRHNHQRRIPRSSLERLARSLSKVDFNRCRTFAEIHDAVEKYGRRIDRIGVLAVYDVALRIGMFLGREPELVYVHAGTKKGAQALGIGKGAKTINPRSLPRAFRRLRPAEIEDCRCIYKGEIGRVRRS